jgi:DNA-binding response OmpR family regulator
LATIVHTTQQRQGRAMRVLVVDDDASILRLLQLLAEDHPRKPSITLAASREAALAQARRIAPDAVVLDADLRGEDGLALVPLLRALTEHVVVVVHSSAPFADRHRALASGADEFLEKGTDPDHLFDRVSDLVDRRSDPALTR